MGSHTMDDPSTERTKTTVRRPMLGSTAGGLGSTAGGSSSSTSINNSSVGNAPHQLQPPAVAYKIVIPTLLRWRPACIVNPSEKGLQNVQQAFILEKTLSFLARHGIPQDVVWLFVASSEEEQSYREALHGSAWEQVNIIVGVRGILAQRNFIVKYFPEGDFLVSIDDDVSDVLWKHAPGRSQHVLRPLPDGSLLPLIFDAHYRMKTFKAFICGLNSTASHNVMGMSCDGISTRNGEVNGFLYCFINRHSEELLPSVADATEDAERSLRYFKKDQCILRYRMYCGVTRCFENFGGLQSLFGDAGDSLATISAARKKVEREAAQRLHELFPNLTGEPQMRRCVKTLEIKFSSRGGCVIPSTTAEDLARNMALEKEAVAAAAAERKDKDKDKDKVEGSKNRGQAAQRRPVQEAAKADPEAQAEAVSTLASSLTSLPKPPKPQPLEEKTIQSAASEAPGKDSSLGSPSSASATLGQSPRQPAILGEADTSRSDNDSDSDEHGCDEPGDPGMDEDAQFFEALRRSKEDRGGVPVAEQDLVVEAVLLSINGKFPDPMAEACRVSEASFKEEQARSEQEEQEYNVALELSLSSAHEAEPPSKRPCVRLEEEAKFRRIKSSRSFTAILQAGEQEAKFRSFTSTLQAMGFASTSTISDGTTRQLFEDSEENVDRAVAMLVSQAATEEDNE